MKSSFNFIFMNVNNVNYYNNISTDMVLNNKQMQNQNLQNNQINNSSNIINNGQSDQLLSNISPEYLQFLTSRQNGINIQQSFLNEIQRQGNQSINNNIQNNNQNVNNNMQNYVNAVNSENANNSMNNVNNDNYRYFVASGMKTGGGSASFFKVDITDQECKVKEADDKFGKSLLIDMQEYADNYTNDKVLPMATLMDMETQLSSSENVEQKKLMFLKNGSKMSPQEILNEVMINQQKLNEAVKEVEQGL